MRLNIATNNNSKLFETKLTTLCTNINNIFFFSIKIIVGNAVRKDHLNPNLKIQKIVTHCKKKRII